MKYSYDFEFPNTKEPDIFTGYIYYYNMFLSCLCNCATDNIIALKGNHEHNLLYEKDSNIESSLYIMFIVANNHKIDNPFFISKHGRNSVG